MKHAVMCNEDGLITAHGIIERKCEDHFESFAGGPPGPTPRKDVPYDVEIERLDHYLFQIAGPTAIFASSDSAKVESGIRTEVARIGMTGNLGYELHGPIEEGPAVYDAVLKAGQGLGIERLGWGTYLVNHVEGGFPQHTWTFISAVAPAIWPEAMKHWQVSGSVHPMNKGTQSYACRSALA
jgi:vanillate/3-O-methylgallate O-demethylase